MRGKTQKKILFFQESSLQKFFLNFCQHLLHIFFLISSVISFKAQNYKNQLLHKSSECFSIYNLFIASKNDPQNF